MKITLQKFQENDAPVLAELANKQEIALNMTDGFPHPYTLGNAQQFISHHASLNPTQVLGVFYEGKLAGAIGLFPQNDIWKRNAELGYWLGINYQRKGIMPLAIHHRVESGFVDWPELNRIFARPFGRNFASRKVLEKCGFVLEACIPSNIWKNNRWEDECIYAIRRKNV